ncbi:hypothetical protein MKW92_036796 [Papaver armeniacum]|nr:hypothetical protein MKW92_036796 [Papaver armeniacum]
MFLPCNNITQFCLNLYNFFGRPIGLLFGPQLLLNLYLAGAIGGSSKKGVQEYFGASGSVNALMLLYTFFFLRNLQSICILYLYRFQQC